MDYTRFSEYEREPVVEYSKYGPSMANYHPNVHREFTEKVVYEEDVIREPCSRINHHMHSHQPERVKVVKYEQFPERRIYEENKVAYGTDRFYLPRY